VTAVLFVVTGSDHWTLADGTLHPTGYWAEELATPHRLLSEAGFDVTVATPGGVAPTVDAVSLAAESTGGKEQADAIAAYLASIRADLENPVKLEEVDLDAYAAVLYPGGHGPMEDLAVDAASSPRRWTPASRSRCCATPPRPSSPPGARTAAGRSRVTA
jgi:aldehyde dehydrogenase (NAD+)